jgi:hypothetical protein
MRATAYSDEELDRLVRRFIPEIAPSDFDRIKGQVEKHTMDLIQKTAEKKEIRSLDPKVLEPFLAKFIEDYGFIQLIEVTDTKGRLLSFACMLRDRPKYNAFKKTDFSDSEWFTEPISTGKPYMTDFYTSKYTGEVCITVSTPITDDQDKVRGVLSFDIQFEEAAKLE